MRYKIRMLVVALSAIIVMSFAAIPQAVAAGPWYVDGATGNDTNTCLSTADACATIAGAIGKAGFVAGDTVNVAAGTYFENLMLSQDVKIVGDGFANTVIDGGGIDRVIDITAGTVILKKLAVQNGSVMQTEGGGIRNAGTLRLNRVNVRDNTLTAVAFGNFVYGGGIYNSGTLEMLNSRVIRNLADGAGIGSGEGGGVFNDGGTVTLVNSKMRNNTATNSGGGIFSAAGTLTLTNSDITLNTSTLVSGGGIGVDGAVVNLTDSTLEDNIANGSGGGLYGDSQSSVTLSNTDVTGNSSVCGGGLYTDDSTLDLADSTVSDNHVTPSVGSCSGLSPGKGGGIFHNGSTLTLTDSTVSGNTAIGDPFDSDGGGIYVKGTLIVSDSTIGSNVAESDGGGIYLGVQSSATVTNSSFTANEATAQSGGGIYVGPNVWDGLSDLTITDSIIQDNIAGTNGGGLDNFNATLTMTNVEVRNNTAGSEGGGIQNAGPLTFTNGVIANNTATTDGGGIHLVASFGGPTDMNQLTITENFTGQNGGGIYIVGIANPITLTQSTVHLNGAGSGGGLYNSGWFVATDSVFSANEAGDGGGIFMYVNGSPTLVLNNSTISGNRANIAFPGDGGGLFIDAPNAVLQTPTILLNNTTLTNNVSSITAGISNPWGLDITARNSIIADQSLGVDCDATVLSAGYNIESGTSCGLAGVGDQQNTSPALLALADYGGLTESHNLPEGSPAIDAGDPLGCFGDLDGDGVATDLLDADQRGQIRVDVPGVNNDPPDAVCDVGAVEHNLVLNGGFEDNANGNARPDSWSGQGLTAGDGWDCTQAYTGDCSVTVTASGAQKRVYQEIPLTGSGLAGDEYQIVIHNGTLNPVGGVLEAGIRVQYTAAAGGGSQIFTIPLTLAAPWQTNTGSIVIPNDYDRLWVVGVSTTMVSGAVTIDDVSLVKVP